VKNYAEAAASGATALSIMIPVSKLFL